MTLAETFQAVCSTCLHSQKHSQAFHTFVHNCVSYVWVGCLSHHSGSRKGEMSEGMMTVHMCWQFFHMCLACLRHLAFQHIFNIDLPLLSLSPISHFPALWTLVRILCKGVQTVATHPETYATEDLGTVSSHKFISYRFKLRVSHPRIVAYLVLNMPFESSDPQGAGSICRYRTFEK